MECRLLASSLYAFGKELAKTHDFPSSDSPRFQEFVAAQAKEYLELLLPNICEWLESHASGKLRVETGKASSLTPIAFVWKNVRNGFTYKKTSDKKTSDRRRLLLIGAEIGAEAEAGEFATVQFEGRYNDGALR